jgi:outer membrane protein assembly factor BamB
MDNRSAPVPPEVDRSLLVVGLNGHLLGINRELGAVAWTNKLPGGGHGALFLAMRYGVLVASAHGSSIFRVDYRFGHTLWRAETTSAGRATILIEPDCIVVAKSGYLDCFTHDGEKLWSQPFTGLGVGAVAMGFPGNVVQADEDT